MLKNYLKVALRTLLKHKSYSVINIVGLAVGMPVCLLIILIIDEQRRIDRFHENQDRIYRITTRAKDKAAGHVHDFASAPAPLSPAMKILWGMFSLFLLPMCASPACSKNSRWIKEAIWRLTF